MDVILTEVENGKSKFIFPSLPEEVKGTNRTNYQSYDILSYGEVKIPNRIFWMGNEPPVIVKPAILIIC